MALNKGSKKKGKRNPTVPTINIGISDSPTFELRNFVRLLL